MAVNEHFVGDPFEIDPEEVVADEDLGCIEVEDGALDGIEEPELPLEDCAPPSPVPSNSDDDSSSSASDVSGRPDGPCWSSSGARTRTSHCSGFSKGLKCMWSG